VSGIAHNILLLTSETYSKYIHQKDRSNLIIFGDGAAATIITKSEEDKIFEFVLGTDGKGYKNLIVPNGGMRNRTTPDSEKIKELNSIMRTDSNLFMNGPEIFNFTLSVIPEIVDRALKKNNLEMKKINYVIFHQANNFMLEHLRKKIEIPKEKFYNNIEKSGNTVSSTIPIALRDCIEHQIIKKGDILLLVGFGVGYSWGATIIEI
jgi:3-oxoacyl-[acyl-carrier-protein] synthase-3